MASAFEILGVYPIKAKIPVHLIEVEIKGYDDSFDWGAVTQEDATTSRDNWQAVYDEQLIDQKTDSARFVFFFHYLDFSKPLITPLGHVRLPASKPLPKELKRVKYYPVD